jgi:flavin reductase (DIM6/NTAB) family NADH-FMN oxidoreductase RutF
VCVEHEALMHQSLQLVGQFGVSVLAAGQEAIARYFADRDRPLGEAQFDNVDWHPGAQTSAPLITGALAHFECQLWHAYNGGDHTIFVGSLLALDRCPDEEALLFLGGKFGRLDSDQNEVSR